MKINQFLSDYTSIFRDKLKFIETSSIDESAYTPSVHLYNEISNSYKNVLIQCLYDEQQYCIELVDKIGNVVYSKSTRVNNEAKVIAIPIANLLAGLYSIIISGKNLMQVIPFEKN